MKRKFKGLLLFLFVSLFNIILVNAEVNLKECEYSEEYLSWTLLNDSEKENTIMPFMCKSNYLNSNTSIRSNNSNYTNSSYSLVDLNHVSAVKNQKTTESCWAFSTIDSIESNLLKKGVNSLNLSPAHIELSTQRTIFNPIRHTFNRAINVGGNYLVSSAYLLNNWGPIIETPRYSIDNLVNLINRNSSITASIVENEKAIYNVKDINFMVNASCTNQAKEDIKKYLVTNGALSTAVYWSDFTNEAVINNKVLKDKFRNGPYYHYDASSYFNMSNETIPANQSTNHAVTIVGWDDNISKSNFSIQPYNDGAWLIKNSYGTSYFENGEEIFKMGDDGYFYISYEDVNVCTMLAGFYNIENDVSDNAYYHDPLGWNSEVELPSTVSEIYLGSVFNTKSGSKEKLDRVTFGTSQIGQKYTVYYAPNGSLKNYENNIIGTGIVDHLGYTSITINNKEISTDKFSIIIKLEAPQEERIVFPISSKIPDSWWSNTPVISNVSYLLDNDGWADTAEISVINSIRAYTTNSTGSYENTNSEIENSGNINLLSNSDETLLEDQNFSNPQTGLKNYNLTFIISLILISVFTIKLKKLNFFKII
ncbi:MAG: C1 family peptidase [Bacilli bacterium]|nr:C1 family peptidase [Bacilli bacterium]